MDLTTQNMGLVFKVRRSELNYSQDYVAYKLGISQNSYSKIELGYVQLTLDRFFSICKIMDIDIAELLTEIPVDDIQNKNMADRSVMA